MPGAGLGHRLVADDAENAAETAFERREAHASTTLDDTVVVDAILDPVGGAIFLRELERIEQGLFEAHWADARTRLGDAATDGTARNAAGKTHAALGRDHGDVVGYRGSGQRCRPHQTAQ